MELLILKENKDYFRVKGEEFERCDMSKATVFPLAQEQDARRALALLTKKNINAKLMKLTIKEEKFL